jgi:hypothetical protein
MWTKQKTINEHYSTVLVCATEFHTLYNDVLRLVGLTKLQVSVSDD